MKGNIFINRLGITLREWKLSDAKALAEIADNKKIYDNLRDGFPQPYSVKDAENFITSVINNDASISFAIEVEGNLAGSIGAFFKDDVYRKSAEIGYFIGENFWGKGIMSHAVQSLTEYIFSNADIIRIYAEPFARNAGSRRVLEKAGFKLEGILKNSVIKNGIIEDSCIYALLRDE